MSRAEHINELTAVILAGGLGTRLRTAVPDRPKALANINGRPFLAYVLDHLCSAGLCRAVLCTGYLGEQLRQTFGNVYRNIRLFYSHEDRPLGTGGALRHALRFLTSDPVLVLNGDSFCDADLTAFWKWHIRQNSEVSLLLIQTTSAGRYGSVKITRDGEVRCFAEKTDKGAGLISAGVYLISVELIESIPENRAVSIESEIFPLWLGRRFYGYVIPGKFIDIGTPEDYQAAGQFFTRGTVS